MRPVDQLAAAPLVNSDPVVTAKGAHQVNLRLAMALPGATALVRVRPAAMGLVVADALLRQAGLMGTHKLPFALAEKMKQ